MAELTPMMKQYLEIKKDNPDSILFFRLGDFYEMFADDAKLASRELDLTLTSRDHGKHAKPEEERVPMCGIPYHASEAYIARLIAKGYKVAICEQMEDPATAKGLVKRDIIRVVTPGTVIDAACLEEKASNFLCGIYIDSQNAGAAFCDISTGKTHLTAFSGPDRVEHVVNELGRFSPAEAVVNDGAASEKALTDALTEKFRCRVENGGEGRFRLAEAERNIRRQFGEEAFDRLPRTNPAAAMALGGLLHYLYETQKTDLSHINDLDYYEQGRFMELDLTARRNLELTETLRDREKRGSLLWVLDEHGTIAEGIPVVREKGVKAWVSIMYGCNNFCSYCIVPYVRGRERSRDPQAVLAEVRQLVEAGYKDITLLGQNVNSYGNDLDLNYHFPDLLADIDRIPGEYLIRFMSSHPKDATPRLFDVMAASSHVAKQLHLPFQSGNDRVLKEMNRRYTRQQYLDLVNYAKRVMPGLVLTSDVIIGFPGETEAEAMDTVSLVEEVGFDALFTFIYSPRPGTKAAAMPDPATRAEKQKWFDRLLEVQNNMSAKLHAAYVGKTVRVLVDGESDDPEYPLTSRTEGNRLVRLKGDKALIGQFADVAVTGSNTWALYGEAV